MRVCLHLLTCVFAAGTFRPGPQPSQSILFKNPTIKSPYRRCNDSAKKLYCWNNQQTALHFFVAAQTVYDWFKGDQESFAIKSVKELFYERRCDFYELCHQKQITKILRSLFQDTEAPCRSRKYKQHHEELDPKDQEKEKQPNSNVHRWVGKQCKWYILLMLDRLLYVGSTHRGEQVRAA